MPIMEIKHVGPMTSVIAGLRCNVVMAVSEIHQQWINSIKSWVFGIAECHFIEQNSKKGFDVN